MINFNDFTRKFSVISNKQFVFLLGAGASATSNVPTALEMTRDFKRRLYASEKEIKITTIEQRFYELEKEIENCVRIKYNNILKNEYGFFFEKTFPSSQDRRNYIKEMLKFAKPSIGYQVIKFLIKENIVWHYITTNFDNLIQKVYSDIVEISEENIATREDYIKINSTSPTVVKLHGDFRYDWLKNTDGETQSLHKLVINKLTHLFDSLGLIIVGYSGRDESVMSFLENIVENETRTFPAGFYWCIREGEVENQRIKILIDKLKKKGIEADFVKITSFDDLLISIYNQIGKNDNEIDEWLSSNKEIQPFESAARNRENYIVFDFMKIIEYPRTFLTFKFKDIKNWKELDRITNGKKITASFFRKGKIIAIGDENEIKETFDKYIDDSYAFEYYTLTDSDLSQLNNQYGFVYGIFYKIFNWHFEKILCLKRFGNKRIFYREEKYKKELDRYLKTLYYYKAFRYSLEFRDRKLLFILTPYYLVSKFQSLDEETYKSQQNTLISNMWNKDVLEDLIYWMKVLKNREREPIKILFPFNALCFLIQPKFYKSGEGIYG